MANRKVRGLKRYGLVRLSSYWEDIPAEYAWGLLRKNRQCRKDKSISKIARVREERQVRDDIRDDMSA